MSKKRKSMETNKIPMVNDFELIVPKFLANPVIRNKKPKLRLMNPVSKERNIATRKNQLVIPIKRKNVRKPMLIEVKNEPVDENLFNPTDRERLDRYNPIDDIEDIKQSKTLKFKNETRGLPIILYKNLRKKEYTQEQLEGIAKRVLKELGIDYSLLSKPQQQTAKRKVKQRIEFNNRKITEFFGKEPIEEEEEEVETKKITKQQKERLELDELKKRENEAKRQKAMERLRKVIQVKLQRIREAKTKRDEEQAKKELKKARKALLEEQKKQKEAEKLIVDAKSFDTLMKEFMELDIPEFYQSVKDTLSKITYDDLKQSIAEIKKVEGKGYKLNMYKDRGGVTYSGDEVEEEFLKTFSNLNERFRRFNEQMKDTENFNPLKRSLVTNEIISTLVYKLNQLLFFHRVEIKEFYNYTYEHYFPQIISMYGDDLNDYLSSFTIKNNNVIFESSSHMRNFINAIIKLNRFNTHTPEMLEALSKPVYIPRLSYRIPDEFRVKLIKVQHLLPPLIEKLYSLLVWEDKDEGEKDLYYGGNNWTGLMKNRRSYTDLTDHLEKKGQSWKAISKYLKENEFSIGGLVSRKEKDNTLTLKYQFGNQYEIYVVNLKNKGTIKRKTEIIEKKEKVEGKGLKDTDFKNIIEATYKPRDVNGWTLDKTISSPTSKVWKKNDGNQVVISHKGTQGFLDWANNAMFVMGGETAYKLTPRYKEAYRVQKLAERKYGRDYKISTIGHSQGGLQAQLLGHRSDETITFNKATRPTDLISASKQRKNQYDYSTRGDPVSIFRSPFEKYKTLNIKGSYNPLHAHSYKSIKESGEIYGDKSF